jgi:hypothetical protein
MHRYFTFKAFCGTIKIVSFKQKMPSPKKVAPSESPGSPEAQGEFFFYPKFSSQEYAFPPDYKEDIKLWRKEGFDLQEEVLVIHGPILEIGGPSIGGFYFLEDIKLPSKPVITNLYKENMPEDLQPYIEQIVDGRDLPYDNESQGIILMQALDVAESTLETINTSEFDEKFMLAEKEMEELALGTLNFEDVRHSLRAQIYAEVWRALASGGLFFTNGKVSEAMALKRLGFEVVAYTQEFIKPPEGLGGFEGISYELVLHKP